MKLKLVLMIMLFSVLNGCGLKLNRASIEKEKNEHYLEIYGGGFTAESAFMEELKAFTKYVCGDNLYNIKNKRLVGALSGSLPGTTCNSNGCSAHQIMQVKLVCDQTPIIEIHPKDESSRWLDPQKDKDDIEEYLEDDYVMRDLVKLIGKPDSIYFNGDSEVIWQYSAKQISVLFKRKLFLFGGYQTNKMILKRGLYKTN